jgi:hypothetical protein
VNFVGLSVVTEIRFRAIGIFLKAPQQMLRTHRSLESYCATLWWRWSVCFVFPCNRAPVEWNWQVKTEVCREKPVPVTLCPPQIPHGLTRDRTRGSAVRGRRLTVWTMSRPERLALLLILIWGYQIRMSARGPWISSVTPDIFRGGQYLKLRHRRFFPHPLRFTIQASYHSTLYNLT